MKYVAAYMLASFGGKASPSVKDIEKILDAAGIDTDAEKAKLVVDALSGKKVEDVIAAGLKKLASVPSGAPAGGAKAAASAPAGGAPAAAQAAPAAKKEEKKEESEEEDMGFGLFD